MADYPDQLPPGFGFGPFPAISARQLTTNMPVPPATREWLNRSEPGPILRHLEADICDREYGRITLLRDQMRPQVDRRPQLCQQVVYLNDYRTLRRPYDGNLDGKSRT